jgi:FMN phosphatase YigB (HAD superfamily)
VTNGRLAVSAITFDFGNTLVMVDRAGLRSVVADTAAVLIREGVVSDATAFLEAWAEERDRQFREEVPNFHEVDVPRRAVRVLARLRGMVPPPPDVPWDDAAAGRCADEVEVELVVDSYSRAFIDRTAPVADARRTLERLAARGFRLGILSNWPLARTIDRFAEAQGWLPFLHAIVVSQRIGTIKPHPLIFRAAEAALGMGERPSAILHVGDDWAADVVGGRGAGWKVAYLRNRQVDTPLPTSTAGEALHDGTPVRADLEIDELAEVDAWVDLAGKPAGASPTATSPTA